MIGSKKEECTKKKEREWCVGGSKKEECTMVSEREERKMEKEGEER